MRRIVLPVVALAMAVAFAGCSASSPEPEESSTTAPGAADQLLEEAKTEAPLTWYTNLPPERNDAVVAAFSEAYPELQVTAFRLTSGELANRFSSERESGVNTAGLITIAAPDFIQAGVEGEWFENFEASEFPELEAFGDYFADGVTIVGVTPFGISYNTDLVDEAPETWTDVLDDTDAGPIILADPRNVPSYFALTGQWIENYGDEYLTDLKNTEPILVDSVVPGLQQLAAGEAAYAIPSNPTAVQALKDQGAPIDIVVPNDTSGAQYQIAIPIDSPSPSFSKLFYEFLLTDAGQQAFNGETQASPIDAPGTLELPEGYLPSTLEAIETGREPTLELLGLQG